MSGVTSNGFEAKRLAEVVADAEAGLSLIVDPISGETLQPDFESDDPAMQVVLVPLEGVAGAWEAGQLVYQQFDPGAAVKNSLSTLVQLNGINRLDASPSIANLTLSGTPTINIPAGQLVSDVDNVNQWKTTEAVTLDGSGLADVDAECMVFGEVTALANTLTNIVTPFPGWVSVTNALPAIVGRSVEEDTDLRIRRDRSTMAPAASPVESVYSNVGNIPGVTYARVRQNNTLAVDSNGIPPKSVAAVIVGGSDEDIAYTLLARTGVVGQWFGSSGMVLLDIQGEAYDVRWTRPTDTNIYIALTIQVINPSIFPVDGIQKIKDAIISYAQGGAPALGVDDGFSDTGFPPGSTVIYSRLYTPINFVPGHRVVSLAIGTAPSPVGVADIPIDWDKVAHFTSANISITIAP